MSLVDDVVAAHGGLDRWRAASAIALHLSSGGPAFAAKGQPRALRDLRATVATSGQSVLLEGDGWTREFSDRIPRPRRHHWRTDDVAAFAACALWTYVALPFALPELDVEEQGRRLVVRFPPSLRTHSPVQVLHVDEDGLVNRHDYTALDMGRWAHASQEVGAYRQVDGLMLAHRRRVRPRAWPHRPVLVWIDVLSARALHEPQPQGTVPA